MKRNTMLSMIAAAAFCVAGARAQGQSGAPAAAPAAAPSAAPNATGEQRKAEWEAGVKADCSAEIGAGGVCAGKDFSTGLEKCLHQNHKTLSAGCKVAVRRRKAPINKRPATSGDAPAAAPAAAPQ